MKTYTAAIALLLLASACGDAPQPITDFEPAPRAELAAASWTLRIDDGVPEEELVPNVEAAHAWERALSASCPIAFTIERGSFAEELPVGEHTIVVRLDDAIAKERAGEASWGGLGSGRGGLVHVRTRATGTPGIEHVQGVVARHELGHAMMLVHRDDGVMRAEVHYEGITEGDAIAFAALHCNGGAK